MKKSVCIVTATRAEYGLLRPVIKKLHKDEEIDLRIAVTGAHLMADQGMTIREIEADQLPVDVKIDIAQNGDAPADISKCMAEAIAGFAVYFAESRPDILVVLGDRYEILSVCIAAMNERIPIVHLYGGETSEGAIDEAIRHAITKMSVLHLTATEDYRGRVIQLGEDPARVYTVGALGVENALSLPLMTREELEKSMGFSLGERYAVGTFHPVTLEMATAEEQTKVLLAAISEFADVFFLFTKANADADGRVINHLLAAYEKDHMNFKLVDSLGVLRYLSALRCASFVIGNSSSGLIEAPAFHIPTINIGDRQKGRMTGKSVIQCGTNKDEIKNAIRRALSPEFKAAAQNAESPYGAGDTSDQIVAIIKEHLREDRLILKKKFYDL